MTDIPHPTETLATATALSTGIPSGHGRHAVVGLSGGVDSAVAAWRLLQAGYRVSALFMVNWTEDEAGYCSAAEDFQSARAVCSELSIPLHRVDFSVEYRQFVFQHFLDELAAGKTPNPDVLCNRAVKFGPFIDYARRLGADFIATGHYAQLRHAEDGPHLLRAVDDNKDQSYFLATVERARFRRVLFPIGDLRKTQVRKIARQAALPNHARADSTGICFIGERRLRPFLARYLEAVPGPVVDTSGAVIGAHRGLQSFTLGQRRGLNIGGRSGAEEAPWYVVTKDSTSNTLVVSQDRDDPRLYSKCLTSRDFHWLREPPSKAMEVLARIRHRQVLQRAQALCRDGGPVEVSFASPQRAAVAGQYVVLYSGEECLGGGEIDAVTPLSSGENRTHQQGSPSRRRTTSQAQETTA